MDPKQRMMQFFTYDHLSDERLKDISAECCRVAEYMCRELPMNAETTTGLRKLLEAKDCFVRAALDQSND
jgi:hypothetical protein